MQLIRSQTSASRMEKSLAGKSVWRRIAPLYSLLMVVAVWQLISFLELIPSFLVPSPGVVAQQFLEVMRDGRLVQHTVVTLSEVVPGLMIGVAIGVILGYLIARIPLADELFSPLIVALQSTPVVAYAPLLVIWFGSGTTSKVITCALIVFFPMLMNTVVGIHSVPTGLRDLMRVSQATRWQTFTTLEIPAAMPVLLTGLKTSATLSVIGAVVGEFIYSSAGLGFMISVARGQFDTPLVFVGVIMLAVIARMLYGLTTLLERYLLKWKQY